MAWFIRKEAAYKKDEADEQDEEDSEYHGPSMATLLSMVVPPQYLDEVVVHVEKTIREADEKEDSEYNGPSMATLSSMAISPQNEIIDEQDEADEQKEEDEKEEATYESIMKNGYICAEVGITMFKWSASHGKEISRWDCIWDLAKYLHSISPKVKVQVGKKRCGVIIDCGFDHNQNTDLKFLEMSRDYFWDDNKQVDSDILYVTDIPAFVNSLAEDEKKIFVPSMPFLRSYTWCGPPLFLPCSPEEINDLQLKIDSIQHLLDQEK